MILIGISGASGSGKSELARGLQQQLIQQLDVAVPILCDDDYYHDQSEIAFEQRLTVNYDHPDSLEHSLLVEHLNRLKKGTSVGKPIYDFSTHTRKPEVATIHPAPFAIVEGILIFHSPGLRDIFDHRIFVETDLAVCLERRIARDVAHRGRTRECVVEQFEATVRPMFYQFVQPAAKHADIRISGEHPFEEFIEQWVRQLAQPPLD